MMDSFESPPINRITSGKSRELFEEILDFRFSILNMLVFRQRNSSDDIAQPVHQSIDYRCEKFRW